MSGSRSNPAERHLAEQHLGDRLAALVDGELGHDARERVLAHLATCPKCKTEADAQRRLKSVFAQSAPPPPSESFLARLQSLPGAGADDIGQSGGPRTPVDDGFATGSSESTGLPHGGVFSTRGGRAEPFVGYVPSGAHAAVLPSEGRGFRIHDVGRPEAERSVWLGRRFAFAAAGAVSLAAIALGGVTVGTPLTAGEQRASGAGSANSNASPLRSPSTPNAAVPDSVRRRSGNPLSVQGPRQPQALAPTTAATPLLSGAPMRPGYPPSGHQLTAPLLAGAGVMSPLVRAVADDAPGGAPQGLTLNAAADPTPKASPKPVTGPLHGSSQIR
ncbi:MULTISPECIES: anti-sigma factor family protein [Streptomyces]|uniref:Membrane protein n=1 Tax=Streptomyces lasiicapitis TaxID=1923961 RepID=A0ABQ2LHS5_9ACTN|nr:MULTISPECIES: zf-HC2 domain-containing protein [Streptomyces]QIB43734.1 zf-HC2 domain-containing protein [Streptomyces aureoverticillatus]GGO34295.1 membrane protein [Streptomyces lasiicapitis]